MAAGAWASCVGEAFLVGGTCRRSPCSHYYTRVSPPTGHPPEGAVGVSDALGLDTRRRCTDRDLNPPNRRASLGQ